MDDFSRTREQLIKELEELRAKINQLDHDNIARQKEEQSLRLTQFTVDRVADAVFWMGRDARFFYVNDVACRSLGYSREELLSMTVQDIDPDYTADVWPQHWNEVKRRGSFTLESRHRMKDGRIFPVEITVNYLEFKGMEYNCAFARNITERKRAEEALAREKYFSEMVINSLPGIFYLVDAEGNFHDWNRNAETVTGYSSDEIKKMKTHEFFIGEDKKLIAEKMQEVFDKGESFTEADLIAKSGRKTRYYFNGRCMTVDNKQYIAGMGMDISELKKIQGALHKARQEWENIFQAIGHPTIILDADHYVIAANRATVKATGKALNDIIGEKCHMVFHGSPAPAECCPFEKMLHSGSLETQDMEIEALGGTYLVSCTPVLDNQGRLQKVIHIATDITERKEAEESLIHEKQRLEEVTSFANCGLMLLDNKAKIIYANRVLEEWFGPFYQIKGKTCYEIFGTEDPEHECACLKTLRTRKSVCTDEFVMAIDGRPMCLNIITFPLKDDTGNIYEITVVVIDITERKQREEELKKFKFISDHANDAHFLVDADARFCYVNEKACRMMGYSERELLSLGVPDVDMVYYMAKYRELFDKILKETVPPIQTVNRRKDGTVFCSEISVTGYKIEDESFMFAVLRDITDRKEAEEQIRKSLKEKEVLLKEVHHRVKNNLSVIYSLLQLQTRYVKEKRYIDMFHESMDRIKSMAIIHEKLYRSDDLVEINFGDYLSDMVESLFLSYGLSPEKVTLKKDIEKITLDINASVPCGLIVNELVSNSLKHAFPEDRQGEIRLTLRRKHNDEIEFAVSDNGIGMPEDLDYRKSGTLGLTLIKSLVDQIGGEIELFGEQGTGFRITFRKQK